MDLDIGGHSLSAILHIWSGIPLPVTRNNAVLGSLQALPGEMHTQEGQRLIACPKEHPQITAAPSV